MLEMTNRVLKPASPLLLFFAMALIGFVGCGGDEKFRVSGTVTYNGNPIESGSIGFRDLSDLGNQKLSGFSKIDDGKFDVFMLPGEKRVEVRANRTALKGPAFEDGRGEENYIPKKYNRKSELTLTVGPDGESSPVFELEGPP